MRITRVSTTFRNRVGSLTLLMLMSTPLDLAAQASDEDQRRIPRVISVTPAVGAEGVDPGLTEIHVKFDMPMSRDGYSFVGGGPHFPSPTDTARWVDAFECALPVKLKPNWEYEFSINNAKFKNFRSVWLVPAAPMRCHFKTAGMAAIQRTPKEQRKINIESYDVLCEAMRNRYSYLELRALDWEKLFAEHRGETVSAADLREWTQRAATMLSAANDLHLVLEMDGEKFPTATRRVLPNWNPKGVASAMPGLLGRSPNIATGKTEDGIEYILIGSFAAGARDEIEWVTRHLKTTTAARAVIIDVRPNSGGSEPLAKLVAAWFVDGPRVYAKHAYRRGPMPDDFTPVRDRTVEPNALPKRYNGPVAVLMGPANMSSCEAFLLMMRQGHDVTLIGSPSFGSSGNPKPAYLPNGVIAHIPSWRAMRPDGTTFEGKGIAPDLDVPSIGVDFSKHDPVLATALKALRTRSPRKPTQ